MLRNEYSFHVVEIYFGSDPVHREWKFSTLATPTLSYCYSKSQLKKSSARVAEQAKDHQGPGESALR